MASRFGLSLRVAVANVSGVQPGALVECKLLQGCSNGSKRVFARDPKGESDPRVCYARLPRRARRGQGESYTTNADTGTIGRPQRSRMRSVAEPNSPADKEVAAMRQALRSANGFRIVGDKSDPKLQGVVSCSYSHGRLASR
jgi:hypothetical protein